jgi:hypothetical protein
MVAGIDFKKAVSTWSTQVVGMGPQQRRDTGLYTCNGALWRRSLHSLGLTDLVGGGGGRIVLPA